MSSIINSWSIMFESGANIKIVLKKNLFQIIFIKISVFASLHKWFSILPIFSLRLLNNFSYFPPIFWIEMFWKLKNALDFLVYNKFFLKNMKLNFIQKLKYLNSSHLPWKLGHIIKNNKMFTKSRQLLFSLNKEDYTALKSCMQYNMLKKFNIVKI